MSKRPRARWESDVGPVIDGGVVVAGAAGSTLVEKIQWEKSKSLFESVKP